MAATTVTDLSSISAYNRGPITTAFIPPTSCLATLTLPSSGGDLFFGHQFISYVDLACYPHGTIAAQNLVTWSSWDIFYYSPAICPSGWTQATAFTSVIPAWPETVSISIESNTNVALCCPSGYSYLSTGLGHQCTSPITMNQVIQYIFPTNNGANIVRGNVSTSTFPADATAWGDGVPVWWQSSDDALLAEASTMTPSGASPTAITTGVTGSGGTAAQPSATTSIPSSTATTSASSTPKPSGLSTGAKVGLGVGIPLAIIAGLALGYLLFRRRRGRGTTDGDAADVPLGKYEHDAPPEPYYDTQQPPKQPAHELSSQREPYHGMHELPSTRYQ
ncbi:uncharacterized protein BDZ99DRAFT_539765 [Mytilinidion resinicola]|uniref:Mid2 domain-containing protein n=1 Tax=Mytilinidion resinicola TaxID=574789 RepID=A0A6A6YA46_9PEZI|nr:uncharacterized protein BDZ99DRAFT_539765 [Mytilinidion resinicola]KAF2805438.1 hypothetical protein BDZ99DRAFT_539765 [Mytilinidion resinicola]